MTLTEAHPAPGPVPPPGTPPGPYDPPSPPTPQQPNPPRRQPQQLVKLGNSAMYPGMKSFQPLENCTHGWSGTPVRAIISHR